MDRGRTARSLFCLLGLSTAACGPSLAGLAAADKGGGTTVVNATVTVDAPAAFVASANLAITVTTSPAGLPVEADLDGAGYRTIGSPWELTGLAEGEHSATVRVRGDADTEQVVTWVVDVTPPSPPTALAVTAPSASTLALSWTAGADGGSGLHSYAIDRGTTAGSRPTRTSVAAPATSAALTGLSACQTYYVTVTCVDRAGNTSSASTEISRRANCGGDGTFTASTTTQANGISVMARGDFDGDDIADLAVDSGQNLQILLGNGSNGFGDGSFATGQSQAVPATIFALAAADFDADRIDDLAMLTTTQLRIYKGQGSEGRGNGQFALLSASAANLSTPQALLIRDVNADRILDLVIGDWGTDTLRVFLGNGANGRGNGGFAFGSAVATGSRPGALAAGDFNADGITDLVVACQGGAQVLCTHLGNGANGRGNGTFAAVQTWLAGGFVAGDVLVGDHNGDCIDDLICTLALANSICFLAGSGNGGRGTGSFYLDEVVGVGTRPWGLLAGDFTGDNLTDYVTLSYLQAGATLVLANGEHGRGDGTFTTRAAGGAGTSLFHGVAGDVDGNGSLDVVAGDLGGELLVLRNNGRKGIANGAFAGRGGDPWLTGNGFGLGISDLDSDKVPDVLVASFQQPSPGGQDFITTFANVPADGLGTGALPIGSLEVVGTAPVAFAFGDFDKNGIGDTAVVCSDLDLRGGGNRVDLMLGGGSNGVGNGGFGSATNIATGTTPRAIVAGDWNADMILDLAVANFAANTLRILLGNGSGGRGDGTFTAQAPIAAGTGPIALLTGDWDSNGIADLAVGTRAGDGTGSLRILLGNGNAGIGDGTFAAGAVMATANAVTGLAGGDFDGDGIADLAAVQYRPAGASSTSGVILFTGNGTNGVGNGSFTATAVIPTGGNALAIAAGDFDHDGILDLAVSDGGALSLAVLRGQGVDGRGNGSFGAPAAVGLEAAAQALATVDLDQDGTLDLIAVGGTRMSLRFGSGSY